MDDLKRKQLEGMALSRLYETEDDEEQWSFLFKTDGHTTAYYIPNNDLHSWDFDAEQVEWLELNWDENRKQQLIAGEAIPNDKEIAEWRLASAKDKIDRASDECQLVYFVPIWDQVEKPDKLDKQILGWALFDCGSGYSDPDRAPDLLGVYDNPEKAAAGLEEFGVCHKMGPADFEN